MEQKSIYSVSDSTGYVGCFSTYEAAAEVVRKHAPVPFVVQRWKRHAAAAPAADTPAAEGAAPSVWLVLYVQNDAVAYISTSKKKAEERQRILARLGLVYTDELDFWEQALDTICPPAEKRLADQQLVSDAFIAPDEQARVLAQIERALGPNPDGPLARAQRENEKFSFVDCYDDNASEASTVVDPVEDLVRDAEPCRDAEMADSRPDNVAPAADPAAGPAADPEDIVDSMECLRVEDAGSPAGASE